MLWERDKRKENLKNDKKEWLSNFYKTTTEFIYY